MVPAGNGPRRRTLGALLALAGGAAAAACAPVAGSGEAAPAELYVGLGRHRSVAVLDVATDVERRRVSLAVRPAGKAYVADMLGDRLWRVDTRANALLTPVAAAGAPIALATSA